MCRRLRRLFPLRDRPRYGSLRSPPRNLSRKGNKYVEPRQVKPEKAAFK
jgi:hypothetical protein